MDKFDKLFNEIKGEHTVADEVAFLKEGKEHFDNLLGAIMDNTEYGQADKHLAKQLTKDSKNCIDKLVKIVEGPETLGSTVGKLEAMEKLGNNLVILGLLILMKG